MSLITKSTQVTPFLWGPMILQSIAELQPSSSVRTARSWPHISIPVVVFRKMVVAKIFFVETSTAASTTTPAPIVICVQGWICPSRTPKSSLHEIAATSRSCRHDASVIFTAAAHDLAVISTTTSGSTLHEATVAVILILSILLATSHHIFHCPSIFSIVIDALAKHPLSVRIDSISGA